MHNDFYTKFRVYSETRNKEKYIIYNTIKGNEVVLF